MAPPDGLGGMQPMLPHSPSPMVEPLLLIDRPAKERAEAERLAPYAMLARDSAGRRYPEPQDPMRTEWERDRDRIVHSTAFRRLMYKSQVFLEREGDHNRTRLSHSLEVAQVARSVASALGLNEILCEALALAHDIGHPPFGHRGEWALDELVKEHGGFRHNAHVLRVLDLLERRSPKFPGVNLTQELRIGLLKHEANADWPEDLPPKTPQPYLEAQVTDMADSTAYNAHDVEDGLREGMFAEEELYEGSALWRRARASVAARYPDFLERTDDANLRVKRVVTEMIGLSITDLIQSSAANLAQQGLEHPSQARALRAPLIAHSADLAPEVTELSRFLFQHFYRHPHLMELTKYAGRILRELYAALVERPSEMAPWYERWCEDVGVERAVCDYLAGMTDRFAESEHRRLCAGART